MGDRDSMTEQTDKKRTKRRASDDYPTPGPVVDAFLDRIDWFRVRSFLEPCAGDGAIIDRAAARMTSPRQLVRGVELRHGGPGFIRADYLELPQLGVSLEHPHTIAGPHLDAFDLAITNPPFNLAGQFLEKLLRECVTVCLLLRASWPAGPRSALLRLIPPTHVYYLESRPAFVATCQRKSCDASAPLGTRECPECGDRMRDTTYMHEYAWFCWDRARLLNTRAPFNWI